MIFPQALREHQLSLGTTDSELVKCLLNHRNEAGGYQCRFTPGLTLHGFIIRRILEPSGGLKTILRLDNLN